MKNIIVSLLLSTTFITTIYPELGCMDNTEHLTEWNLDKPGSRRLDSYQYVECHCPCDRYARSFNRGRCEQCLHFHRPLPLIIVGYEAPDPCRIVLKKEQCCQRSAKCR
jgi:hypothetical protein